MMKVFVLLSVVLLAGASANPTPVPRNVGDEYAFTITAILQEIASCVLITPAGDKMEFSPGVESQHGDRFELLPSSSMPACSVLVKDLQKSDSGVWEIAFVNTSGTGNSQAYQLTIIGDEIDGDAAEDTTENDGNADAGNGEVGASTNPTPVPRNVGDEYAFTITAILQEIATCVLITPAGDKMEFSPGVESQHGDRFKLLPSSSMPACSVLVKDLQISDSGVWEIAFVNTSGTGNSQAFQLTVISDESDGDAAEDNDTAENDDTAENNDSAENVDADNGEQDTSKPSSENISELTTEASSGNDYIQWLEVLQFPTRTGQVIDISLPRINQFEECSLRTPKGNIESLDTKIDGVTPHKISYFVSCRITIGPMAEDLLGDWSVCGKYTENGKVIERCQPAKIYWNSVNNPAAKWHTDIREEFDHPVHYAGMLSPAVIGNGEVVACHIITREKEDLQITPNSRYNEIKVSLEHFACRFDIGPMSTSLLGEWVIYGLFTNSVEGLHEVRLPFSMYLYDQENPYNQAYNTSVLDPVTRIVNMGNILNLQIAGAGQVDGCFYSRPNSEMYTMGSSLQHTGANFVQKSDVSIACTLAIGPITEVLLGEWTVIGKFSKNGVFSRIQQTFDLVEEDPENPIQENRTITYLTAQSVQTEKGLSNKFVIPSHDFISGESCHIRTPDGLQYELVKDFKRVSGIEFVQDLDIECGVIISVVSEDVVGEWTLIARARHHSLPIERRLHITISVEVTEPENISIPEVPTTTWSLVRDKSVSQYVGPEDSVYCRLEDPQGVVVFDSFGRCQLTLDKVGLEHHGTWKMLIATPGKVVAEEHSLVINVVESEGKKVVLTQVTEEKPVVTISCSVSPVSAPVTGCKFRDPHGKILIAASGLEEDRYSFYGAGAGSDSGLPMHECGLRIDGPHISDLGLWRCAMETDAETYYGHLAVLSSWAFQEPEVAAVVQREPVVKATRSLVSVVEEETTVLSCSVEANIRYCYFRAANGTTFTVSPGMKSSSMEYVGAGFEAGECGVRFHGLLGTDSGRWSCHVGLLGHEEQSDQIQLNVHERMSVTHFHSHSGMTVRGVVYEGRALDYCRFVRIDGLGFTNENTPSHYTFTGILGNGECELTVHDPTMLDLHPWTVAARIHGQAAEITKDTMESLLIGGEEPAGNPPQVIYIRNNGFAFFMYLMFSFLILSIVVGALVGPKKNREWTAQRATAVRRSISNGFRKQPQVQESAPQYTP